MKHFFSLLFLLASCRQSLRKGGRAAPDSCLLEGHFGIPYLDPSRDSSRQFVRVWVEKGGSKSV